MDFIIRISDEINSFDGPVEVVQLSTSFSGEVDTLQEMININNRMVEGAYSMSLQDVLACFNEAASSRIESETPILPKNCVKQKWINKTKNHQLVYIEVPKQRFDMVYQETKIEQVGFPRLIFKYEINRQRVTLSNVYAVKDHEFLKNETEIYYFPFSHVSTSGHVCMGMNSFPEISDIYKLSTFHLLFLNASFGEDYGAKTTLGLNVRDLFTKLSNQDFNDDWLLPNKDETLKTI